MHLDANGSIILRKYHVILCDVVADDDESGPSTKILDNPPQCGLRIIGHGVCLVEYDDLVVWTQIIPTISLTNTYRRSC
jgi:hypothetical protein